MSATHVEFVSAVADTTCPDCLRDTAREAMLVNRYGLVLARGTTCLHCGHVRHLAARRSRREVRGTQGVRVPRIA
jgi:hypothetical protein